MMKSQLLEGALSHGGAVIHNWQPENPRFWLEEGKPVAVRNLLISIPALLLSFAVWMVWSAVAVRLNGIGFNFSTNQLFWLTALPGLSGATLRIFYAFMVPIFGGRRWTTFSTLSLLVPALWMGWAVCDVHTSYRVFVIISLLCGLGGGNFASSMSNISFFYPKSQQGTALGLNAGLGNLGVSVVQFCVPLVIAKCLFGAWGGHAQYLKNGQAVWLQNAAWVWVPLIGVVAIASWLGMNDLGTAQSSFREQAVIFRRKHTWLMCWLYTATFGSFIGYAAALPMLTKTEFPGMDPLKYAFLGPLVGALARPLGGWVADRLGGARVTLWNFVVMTMAVFGVLYFLPHTGQPGNFIGFLLMFLVMFVTTGIGNGSTFRMIPIIFRVLQSRQNSGDTEILTEARQKQAGKESAAVLGFSSAIAAFGAFFIPKSFGSSISLTGSPELALYVFIAFYVSCMLATWWWYARHHAEVPC